jgi:hypothetical protein
MIEVTLPNRPLPPPQKKYPYPISCFPNLTAKVICSCLRHKKNIYIVLFMYYWVNYKDKLLIITLSPSPYAPHKNPHLY